MKKFALFSFLLATLLLLIGCSPTSRTMARNLDSTISSLVYCVSNLDLLNNKELNNVNYITNNLNKSINNAIIASKDININIETELNTDNKAEKENNANNDKKTIILDKKDEILDKNLETKTNTNTFLQDDSNKDLSAKLNNNFNNNNDLLDIDNNFAENHNSKNVINSENISPETIKQYSKDIFVSHTSPSNADTTYGDIYSSLEASSKRIEKLITDLTNIKSVIMLYISDLYNGSIELSNADMKSINSYANIIKEATAYLKSNIGSVKNHISEANNLANSDGNISLANSHIIRATETLNTRCAKLESAIVATYNIADTIKNSTLPKNERNTTLNNNYGNNNLSQTEQTLAEPFGDFNFFNGSPNYAMNNPYNMGVNGMRYMMPYRMNYGGFGGYGGYPYINNYPIGYGYGGYQNFGYYPYNYGMGGFIGGYGNGINNSYGDMNNFAGGYGNNFGDINSVYPYGNNFGFNGTVDNGINGQNNIMENNAVNTPALPNVLTGLVSNDNQEPLKEKLESKKNIKSTQENINNKEINNKITKTDNKNLKISCSSFNNHIFKNRHTLADTPKLQKAQNMSLK